MFLLCRLNESLTLKTPRSHIQSPPSLSTVSLTASDAQAGQTLHSSSSCYSVLDLLGEGCYGKIVASMNIRTKQMVALKILKDTEVAQDTEHEVGD